MIFASTSCLGTPDLWSVLDAYAAAGLTSVELGACTLDSPTGLARRLRERAVAYMLHNYFPPPDEPFVLNLASPDPDTRARSLEHGAAAIQLAAAIGSSSYSVHAGFVADPVGYSDGSFIFPANIATTEVTRAKSRFVDAIEHLLDHAERHDVQLLVENNVCLPRHRGLLLLQTAEELEDFFGCFASNRLGLLLDTGHLLVTAATFGFDVDEFVARLTKWVGAFHVHENDGLKDSHLPVTRQGWVASMLAAPDFADVPICVEARFDSARDVARHIATLHQLRGDE